MLNSPSDVMSAERRGVFSDWRLSHFLQSWEEESQCGWCVVLSFAFLSLSWSSSLHVSSAFFWSSSTIKKFVFYSIFIYWSDQIGFSLFLSGMSRIGRKIASNDFYFLTNFMDILLCTDPMRKSSFFHFEESLAPITSGEFSHGC